MPSSLFVDNLFPKVLTLSHRIIVGAFWRMSYFKRVGEAKYPTPSLPLVIPSHPFFVILSVAKYPDSQMDTSGFALSMTDGGGYFGLLARSNDKESRPK